MIDTAELSYIPYFVYLVAILLYDSDVDKNAPGAWCEGQKHIICNTLLYDIDGDKCSRSTLRWSKTHVCI